MKKFSEFEKSNPDCLFPDLVSSHYRIADKSYRDLIDEILREEPPIHPKGKENLAFVTDTIHGLIGQDILLKTTFDPKHLHASVELELPFLVFDEASLEFMNLCSDAIESIFIRPEHNKLVVAVLVRYYESERTPHEIALEKLRFEKNGGPEIKFLI